MERTVDGLSDRCFLQCLLQCRQCSPPERQVATDQRRTGRQRRSGFHLAGCQRLDESEQELRTALPAGQDAQPRRSIRNAQNARFLRQELVGAGAAGVGVR